MPATTLSELERRMLEELKAVTPLCQELCTVALNQAVADHLPYGLREKVVAWLRDSRGQAAIREAEGQ